MKINHLKSFLKSVAPKSATSRRSTSVKMMIAQREWGCQEGITMCLHGSHAGDHNTAARCSRRGSDRSAPFKPIRFNGRRTFSHFVPQRPRALAPPPEQKRAKRPRRHPPQKRLSGCLPRVPLILLPGGVMMKHLAAAFPEFPITLQRTR